MHIVNFLVLFVSTITPIITQPVHKHGWTELAPIARGPRQEHSVAVVGTDVYIIGRIPQESSSAPGVYPTLDRVEVFSVPANKWRDAASLPTTINHGNVATVDGKIHILGGLDGETRWSAIGNCYEYSLKNNSWRSLPSMLNGQARGASAMGVHRSTIYVAGGQIVLDTITGAQTTADTVNFYDTKTQEWVTLPSLPEGRDHVGGKVIDDTFYVVGGRINGVINVRNTVFAMNLTSSDKKWVGKATMPTARGGLSVGAIGSKIYTFGGEGDRDLVPNGVYNNVEVYDTKSDMWERLPPMAFPRHGPSGTNAASTGSRIYIPGGGNLTGAGPVGINDFFQP